MHSSYVTHLVPLGDHLLSVGADGCVMIWSSELKLIKGPLNLGNHIMDACYTETGIIGVPCCDHKVHWIRPRKEGKMEVISSSEENSMSFTTVDYGNNMWAASGLDSCIHLFDADFKPIKKTFYSDEGWAKTIWKVRFGQNQSLFSAGRDAIIAGWSFQNSNLKVLNRFQGHSESVVEILVQNGYIYSGSDDCTIRQWNVETGKCTGVFIGHEGGVYGLCKEIEQCVLYSGSRDMEIRFWDTRTQQCIRELTGVHSDDINCLCIMNNVLFSGSDDCSITRHDLRK